MANLNAVKLGLTYRELMALLNTNFSTLQQMIEDNGDIVELIGQHNVAADAHADLVKNMITDVKLADSKDGVITFTRKDGSTFSIDTMLEKVVTNFTYNEETGELELTQEDGTVQKVSLARFIDTYVGTADGEAVQVKIAIDAATKKISATIEDGVITKAMLHADLAAELDNKVVKVDGKQLSTEDYSTVEKEKLAGVAENANHYILPVAENELGGVKNGGNVSIAADGTMSVGNRISFTDTDERWAEGTDGEFVLSVTTTAIPFMVMELTESGYEQVFAQVFTKSNGFDVVSSEKFAGIVVCV